MKIKKGDKIKVLAGKDSGKTGKVLQVFPKENRISVEGLNILIKHLRPQKKGEKGQRIEFPGLMNASNAILVCPKCGKTTRVSYKVGEKNENSQAKKFRVCRKCGETID